VIAANLQPAVLEFIDRSSLEAVSRHLGRPLSPAVFATVLIEFDGSPAEVAERQTRCLTLREKSGALAFTLTEEPGAMEELWQVRRTISPAIAAIKPKKINEDIAVPLGRIPETVETIARLGRQHDILVIMFGHFGDGNIHTNLLVDPADPDEMARADRVLDGIFRHVTAIHGTLSGEHGIGLSKKPFMSYQFTPVELDLFKRIKTLFDPDRLLNPGKICD
jgi:D-lactate dehydrogenase (quinone)